MRNIYRHGAYLCLLATSMSILSGCATILQGTNQNVNFDSVPKGSAVYLDGKEVAVTPCTITIKRDHEYILQIKKEGYETKTFLIGSSQSNEQNTYRIGSSVGIGWVVLDIIPGLVAEVVALGSGSSAGTAQAIATLSIALPVLIDESTGAWSSIDETNVNTVLDSVQTAGK
jgi:hypothetical protein